MEVNYGGTTITCSGCGAMEANSIPCTPQGLRLPRSLRASYLLLRRDHLSQEPHAADQVVLRDVSTDQHTLWRGRQRARTRLGRTYKCAWRMASELRELMASAITAGRFPAMSRLDETLVGGQAENTGREKAAARKRQSSLGWSNANSEFRSAPVADDRNFTLEPIILENVEPNSLVTTDGHTSYQNLGLTYQHSVVKHSENEYVRYDHAFSDGKLQTIVHHTNTIEGHWFHFKRAIRGTHVHVSPQHLWKYCCRVQLPRKYGVSHTIMFSRRAAAFALQRYQRIEIFSVACIAV